MQHELLLEGFIMMTLSPSPPNIRRRSKSDGVYSNQLPLMTDHKQILFTGFQELHLSINEVKSLFRSAIKKNQPSILNDLLNTYCHPFSDSKININKINNSDKTFLDEAFMSLSFDSSITIINFLHKYYECIAQSERIPLFFDILKKLNNAIIVAKNLEDKNNNLEQLIKFIHKLFNEKLLNFLMKEADKYKISILDFAVKRLEIEIIEILLKNNFTLENLITKNINYIYSAIDRQDIDIIRLILNIDSLYFNFQISQNTNLVLLATKFFIQAHSPSQSHKKMTVKTASDILNLILSDKRINILERLPLKEISFLKFTSKSSSLKEFSHFFFHQNFFFSENLLSDLIGTSSKKLNEYNQENTFNIIQHVLPLSDFLVKKPLLFDTNILLKISIENVVINYASQILNPYKYSCFEPFQNLMLLVRFESESKVLFFDIYDAEHLYSYLESGLTACPASKQPICTNFNPNYLDSNLTYLIRAKG
jgi:hypothetical protein